MQRLNSTLALSLISIFAFASGLRADGGFDLGGSSGVPQQGRGGAWLAKADDPLAVFLNPAGLGRQGRSVHVGGDLMFMNRCYTRLDANGQPVGVGGGLPVPGTPGGPSLQECNLNKPFLNPQIAAVFRLTDRMAFGVSLHGPHGIGKIAFPETVPDSRGVQPAPGRFMLDEVNSKLSYLTLSTGYVVNDKLSLGAGFMWGMFAEKGSLFAEARSPQPPPGQLAHDDFFARGETKATLDVKDPFVPGFILGGLWSVTDRISLASTFHWQDALRFSGDVSLESRYWNADGSKNQTPCGPGEAADCNITNPPGKDLQGVFHVPWEAKVGLRYRRPRDGAPASADAMSSEIFDLELDGTYSKNSVVKTIDFDLTGSTALPGTQIAFNGVPGATIPTALHLDKHWKDVFGVRFGGDRVIKPNRLTLRAGTFYESKGGRDQFLNLHFFEAARLGAAGGGTLRFGRRYDLAFAYQHTFFGSIDNGGKGAVLGLSGDPANDHSTWQPMNGGKITSTMNEVGLSLTVRF
jgi:long-subunit fatty acid transport protein